MIHQMIPIMKISNTMRLVLLCGAVNLAHSAGDQDLMTSSEQMRLTAETCPDIKKPSCKCGEAKLREIPSNNNTCDVCNYTDIMQDTEAVYCPICNWTMCMSCKNMHTCNTDTQRRRLAVGDRVAVKHASWNQHREGIVTKQTATGYKVKFRVKTGWNVHALEFSSEDFVVLKPTKVVPPPPLLKCGKCKK